jgi:hypothetical protein
MAGLRALIIIIERTNDRANDMSFLLTLSMVYVYIKEKKIIINTIIMGSVEKLHSMLKNKKYENDIYIRIFHILHTDNGVSYTNNSNGIFFILGNEHAKVSQMVVNYLEQINSSNNNHLINLQAREQTQEMYKKMVSDSIQAGHKPVSQEPESDDEYEGPGAPDILIQKKKYRGVYKRLDDIMRNMRKNRKNKTNYATEKPEETKTAEAEHSEIEEDEQLSDVDSLILEDEDVHTEEPADEEELFGCYTDEED